MSANPAGPVIGQDERIPVSFVSSDWFKFLVASGLERCIPIGLTNNLTPDLRMRSDLPGADQGLQVAVINFTGQNRNLEEQEISGGKRVKGYLPVTNMVVARLSQIYPGLRVGGVVPQFVSQYDNEIVASHLLTAPNRNVAFWDPDGSPQGRNSLRLDSALLKSDPEHAWVEDLSGNGISSYEVIQALALALYEANPNLQRIIVMGHSAGAILASHLAVTFMLDHPKLRDGGVEVVYMPANASNVPNLNEINPDGRTPEKFGRPHTVEDVRRLLYEHRDELGDPNHPGYLNDANIAQLTRIENLAHADDYPCGVGGDLPPLLLREQMSRDDFRRAAAMHTIVGIAGMHDNRWTVGLGVDLSRLLLGINRKERMVEWLRHLKEVTDNFQPGGLEARGSKGLVIVPGAEHDASQVFLYQPVLNRMVQGMDFGPVCEPVLAF